MRWQRVRGWDGPVVTDLQRVEQAERALLDAAIDYADGRRDAPDLRQAAIYMVKALLIAAGDVAAAERVRAVLHPLGG
jgi:hypothetical protein